RLNPLSPETASISPGIRHRVLVSGFHGWPAGPWRLLSGDHLVTTGHHDDRTELQSLRQVHRAEGDVPAGCIRVLVEHPYCEAGPASRGIKPQSKPIIAA